MSIDKEVAALSILEAEESIQAALELLRSKPSNGQLMAALAFLAPEGYHPVVELQEDGRKKRRTASAANWSPRTGEILISFSKDTKEAHQNPRGEISLFKNSPESSVHYHGESPLSFTKAPNASVPETKLPQERQLCAALEEVERQGRAFIALKWFRDDVLPNKGFSWASDPEERQGILAKAIEDGLVLTSRITNPHSPFPTTTIRLNRARLSSAGENKRYSPVRIQGEPLSATILHDRGER